MSFSLNTNNKTFNQKQKNLFDQLDQAAKTNKRTLVPEDELEMETDQTIDADTKKQKKVMKHFKRQESIFKRPEAPISKCLPVGRVPGFRKNPQNWTKYTLKDVEDLSDKSNTKAALSFLKELEQRKSTSNENVAENIPEKIEFKKSAIIKNTVEEVKDDTKITFKSSKVVMPEYVVGQKMKKERKNRKIQAEGASQQLKLDHLFDDENDEA